MANTSNVQIANMALSLIGAKSKIESLDEKSPEAAECKLWFEHARSQALEGFDWSFARKRLQLGLHGDDPPDTWVYRYDYPADCVAMRKLENPVGRQADAVPFQIETSDNGSQKTILTDLEEAIGVYTFEQKANALYTLHFVDTFAASLAFRIAMPLTGKKAERNNALALFQALLVAAPAQNANEEVEDKPREAEHIRAREN